MRPEAPVVIAGAGPAGLTLALGLARCGVRSLVLEAAASLAPESRAPIIALTRTLEIVRALAVLDVGARGVEAVA